MRVSCCPKGLCIKGKMSRNHSVCFVSLQQHHQTRRKLFEISHSLRSMMYGQDRYRRRYWVLPHCGGVFIEAMESGEGTYDASHTELDEFLCWDASICSSDCAAHFMHTQFGKQKSSDLMLQEEEGRHVVNKSVELPLQLFLAV